MLVVLEKLNRNKEVEGSMLITKDGLIIASSLPEAVSKEKVSAFTSAAAQALTLSIRDLNVGGFTRYTMISNEKRVIIIDLGKSYLVVLTPKDINLANVNVDVFQAANMIKKSGRLEA